MTNPAIPPLRFTFRKSERFCGRRAFDYFFKHSSSLRGRMLKLFFSYPFPAELVSDSVSFAFIVPKKVIPKAHDRNRIKRILREFVRLNKHTLINKVKEREGRLVIALKWESKEMPKSGEIDLVLKAFFEKVIVYIETRTSL